MHYPQPRAAEAEQFFISDEYPAFLFIIIFFFLRRTFLRGKGVGVEIVKDKWGVDEGFSEAEKWPFLMLLAGR